MIKIIRLLQSDYNEEFKVNKILEILGIDSNDITLETKTYILNQVMDYTFKTEEKHNGGERMFDLELDYKYYWCDFWEFERIDLNKDDISYWKFDAMLESIFLKEHSTMGQVLTYRGYKKQSGNYKSYESEQHKFYMQKKSQYALPQRKEDLDKGMDKMWEYLQEKAKGKELMTNE